MMATQKIIINDNDDRPTTIPNHNGGSIRILTQNVWCHYPMSFVKPWTNAMAGYRCESRLDLLATHIEQQKYDVVCLQELFVWRVWPLQDKRFNFDFMVKRLSKSGYVHYTNPFESMFDNRWIGQNSGVIIFSRIPIDNVESVVFNQSAEKMNTKGFVVVDVTLPSNGLTKMNSSNTDNHHHPKTVRIVSAHLDAMDITANKAQLSQIANHLQQKQSKDRSPSSSSSVELIICGDLNVCPQTRAEGGFDNGEQYAHLISKFGKSKDGLGLTSAWPVVNSSNEKQKVEPTMKAWTLDHIFFREAAWNLISKSIVRVANEHDQTMSDHLGLEITIQPK